MRLRVVADIPESGLSDIRHHPPPRLPDGRLKRNKIKKPPLAVKKPNSGPIPTFPKGKELYPNALARGSLVSYPFCEKVQFQLRVTPAANRNSYRVAMIGGVDTQGSVLRPQPWAGELQLLQSCCCLWIFIYCGWCAPTGYAWLANCGWFAHMRHVWLAHCG